MFSHLSPSTLERIQNTTDEELQEYQEYLKGQSSARNDFETSIESKVRKEMEIDRNSSLSKLTSITQNDLSQFKD